MLLSHFGATVFCEAWSLFCVDFIHCGLAQLPELCPTRAKQKMFPSAFQDVHAIMPALSCAAEPASPGAYGQYSALYEQHCGARGFSSAVQANRFPRFRDFTLLHSYWGCQDQEQSAPWYVACCTSPPLWSGRAHGPVRGCHPGRRRCEDGTVSVRFTWTWDWLLGISYPFHLFVSSRISFSARPLSDVAASQVPSVAAAAVLHFSHNSEDATLAVPIGFLSSFTYFLVFGVFHWSLFLLLWSIELGRTHRR